MTARSATTHPPLTRWPAQAPARAKPARRGGRGWMTWLAGLALLVVVGGIVIAPLAQRLAEQIDLPLEHASTIRSEARSKKLDPALVAAVVYVESRFRDRTSDTGARGLMQLMPDTAKFIADRKGEPAPDSEQLGRPEVNIAYGSFYLRYLLDRFGGNATLALAAYNGGETNVEKWVADDPGPESAFKVSDIPFPETRAYVQRVLDARASYRDRYARELGIA